MSGLCGYEGSPGCRWAAVGEALNGNCVASLSLVMCWLNVGGLRLMACIIQQHALASLLWRCVLSSKGATGQAEAQVVRVVEPQAQLQL